jgi:hypothetical protein
MTTDRASGDPLAAGLSDHPYEPGPRAADVLADLGVDLAELQAERRSRRPLLLFC